MLDLNNGTGGFLGAIDETTLFFFTVCIRGTKRVKGLVKKYRGVAGAFRNVVDKKHMTHPFPSAQK